MRQRSLYLAINLGLISHNLLAIFSVTAGLRVPGSLLVSGEGELGVLALVVVPLEVDPEEAAVIKAVVAPV